MKTVVVVCWALWGIYITLSSLDLMHEKFGIIAAGLSILVLPLTIIGSGIYAGFWEHNWAFFAIVFGGPIVVGVMAQMSGLGRR